MTPRRRASSPEAARAYRQRGHEDALAFALAIGLDEDYQNDPQAKKDVIDPSGDAHSVKSGSKKWQIFLYRRNRFLTDDGFQALNGVGGLLVACIDAFPPSYEDYVADKEAAKERLKLPMRELKDRFQQRPLRRAFLRKAIFNGGEVDYLTILDDGIYHVFHCDDVVDVMGDAFEVVNSTARRAGEFDGQKVLFRHEGRNVGELEMRVSSKGHYPEVLFNMNRAPCLRLLLGAGLPSQELSDRVRIHGRAIRRFGNWRPHS